MTTTPLQALSLLNGSFTRQQAEFFAERVRKEAGEEVSKQAAQAFRLALGRLPTETELTGARDLIERRGLPALCRALLNANEFVYH